MGEPRILYAIAESRPLDAITVRDMRNAVNSLLQLNLKRFRVPQTNLAKYSALDIVKQGLELLYEFSPSGKNYREAMRTLQVYSEGDLEMLAVLQSSFRLIANAVYNAYSGQRQAESLAPQILFLQGVPFEPSELQQSFRFVGVTPPTISPPSVKKTIFLDEGFDPYKLLLEGKITGKEAERGREEHWAKLIRTNVDPGNGTALIRAGMEHVDLPRSAMSGVLGKLHVSSVGKLQALLRESGIEIRVIHKVADVNQAFGK
jgi:hypothetical protein